MSKLKPYGRANTRFRLPDGNLRSPGLGLSCGVPPHSNEVCPRIWGDRWVCRLEPLGNLPGSGHDFIGPIPASGHSPFSALSLPLPPSLLFIFEAMLRAPVNHSPLHTPFFSGLEYFFLFFLSPLPPKYFAVTAPSWSFLVPLNSCLFTSIHKDLNTRTSCMN